MRFFIPLFLISQFLMAQTDNSAYAIMSYKAASGLELPYRLLLPKDFDKGEFYPLIVFLHGAGERGNDNELQLLHGSNLFLDEKNRNDFPVFVLFPQCREESRWSSVNVDTTKTPLNFVFDYSKPATDDLAAVIELISQLRTKLKIQPDQIYVAGLSMGGMGTFEIVYRNPDLFAAAMPICGGGDPEAYKNWKGKTKFWMFHGDADPVVSVEESRQMKTALEAIKQSVKYTEYPGVSHDSWKNAFAEKDFISWLFAKQ